MISLKGVCQTFLSCKVDRLSLSRILFLGHLFTILLDKQFDYLQLPCAYACALCSKVLANEAVANRQTQHIYHIDPWRNVYHTHT